MAQSKKQKEFFLRGQNIYLCFIDYAKAFDCVDHNKLVPNQERSTSRLYIVTCLFNLYAKHIMWNAGLDEAKAEIKTVGRNISDLRYADDTTLMAESEEELKSLLINVKKKSEKTG